MGKKQVSSINYNLPGITPQMALSKTHWCRNPPIRAARGCGILQVIYSYRHNNSSIGLGKSFAKNSGGACLRSPPAPEAFFIRVTIMSCLLQAPVVSDSYRFLHSLNGLLRQWAPEMFLSKDLPRPSLHYSAYLQ